MFEPNFAAFSAGIVEGMSGVQIGPGATAFTRMPSGASNCARPLVKLAIAPFVAAYASNCGDGSSAWIDVVLMIDAPGFMCAAAAFARKNMLSMFVRKVYSISSREKSASFSCVR